MFRQLPCPPCIFSPREPLLPSSFSDSVLPQQPQPEGPAPFSQILRFFCQSHGQYYVLKLASSLPMTNEKPFQFGLQKPGRVMPQIKNLETLTDFKAMAVNVDNACLLAASWINCVLFTLEIFLAFEYFKSPSKPLLHKVSVGAILAFDTICTFAVCVSVYLVVVKFSCQTDGIFVRSSLQVVAAILFTTHTTAAICQLFLAHIYVCLTQNHVITSCLIFGVVVQWRFGLPQLAFTYSATVLILVTNSPYGWAFLISKVGTIACATTDIFSAVALTHTFFRLEQTLATRVSMRSRLRRLVILTFTSGLAVSSVTLLVMILLIKNNPGRVYALTVLCNFLVGTPNQSAGTLTTAPSFITAVIFRNDHHSSMDEPVSAPNLTTQRTDGHKPESKSPNFNALVESIWTHTD
ncbi:hypothetical protein K438DRAFT_1756774 [Mycena galopus ATCC 62051]|nr:hypothetical protein K438DRAFT_1756774 [Mycena galopus ATCC 62051]